MLKQDIVMLLVVATNTCIKKIAQLESILGATLRVKISTVVATLLMVLISTGTATCAPAPGRIVSLAPAVTEILYALGLGARVVGVTNVCDLPLEARKKPKVGGMANPSIEVVVSLKPDVVVMTSDGNPREIAKRLAGLGIRTYVFGATRLAELPSGIREMGQALGAEIAADRLANDIEKSVKVFSAMRQKPGVQTGSFSDIKVIFIIWPAPLIVAGPGTIMDDAMTVCGFSNIAADSKVPYPRFSLESVIERRPDLIIIGKGHEMKKKSEQLLRRLNMLEAVRKGRICYMDDPLYRPGPRIPQGIAELNRCGMLL